MKTYRDLKVWRMGYVLVRDLHLATRAFPAEERFELSRDLRRTSRSVIYNISEGSGRRTIRDQIRFLSISAGSASELECQLLLCADLHLIAPDDATDYLRRIAEVRRMLYGMMAALERDLKARRRVRGSKQSRHDPDA